MLSGMLNTKASRCVPIAMAFAVSLACSDQGAVKRDAPKPAAAEGATRPPAIASVTPPASPPAGAPALPPVPEGSGKGANALAWKVPEGWITEQPSSPMRRAQYRVPGKAGDGECAVFYFGPGQGGDPASNAARWAEQFTLADGSPAQNTMKTSELEVGGQKVLMVEVAGTYKGGMTMTMAPAVAKPGYRLLGAIAPGPDANWYFKFTGPDATINAQRSAFVSMVKSLTRGAS